MQSSRLPRCWKVYCFISHSFLISFLKISRWSGSQFSFFGSFFISFLMVYVYKNVLRMNQKWLKNENCEHPYCCSHRKGQSQRDLWQKLGDQQTLRSGKFPYCFSLSWLCLQTVVCQGVVEQLNGRKDHDCQHRSLHIGGYSVAECQHLALEDWHSRTWHLMWNKGFSLILVAPMTLRKDTDISDIEIIEK